MTYPTFSDIETRVRRELDIIDEPLVTQAEIMSYVNQAIDSAEAEIHTLYEDYFLKKGSINLVTNQSDYSLPSDIYGDKIRGVVYNSGGELYEVKRYTNVKRKFEKILRTEVFGNAETYQYLLVNDSAATGVKMHLFPASRVTLTGGLTIWYLRNANRITATSDPIDIPEFSNFIVAYTKWLIGVNKPGLVSVEGSDAEAKNQLELMRNTLSSRTPDDFTEVYMDLDLYEEHS